MRLAGMWYTLDQTTPSEIATLLRRDKSTLTRYLVMRRAKKLDGRLPAFSEAKIDRIVHTLERMVAQANQEYRVTAAMLQQRLGITVSIRVILQALHSRGIYFRSNREKPLLTDQDVLDRKAFAQLYSPKPEDWWISAIHMHIDVKFFKVYM